MSGQFEQAINAVFLEKLKCGVNLFRPTEAGIGDFLYRLPEMHDALSDQQKFDNRPLLNKVDELLANDAEQAKMFHRMRKTFNAPPQTPSSL